MRAHSLDALRGYAILTMVLSATVVYSILPGWMYHMQEPPPDHIYDPNLAGLTWVDLVFPFFLFAMGAAFAFSLRRKVEKGESKLKIIGEIALRYVELTFFAILIQHFYPYMLSNPQDPRAWFLAVCCFAILFPMFMRLPVKMPRWGHLLVKIAAFGIAIAMLLCTDYADGREFSLYTSNIIILLLANMAFFGSLVYLFTIGRPMARIVVMIAVLAIILSGDIEGSWTQAVVGWTPAPWMYRFGYLLYLGIVIPGSLAGDILRAWMLSNADKSPSASKLKAWTLLAISLAIIVTALVGLYQRESFVAFAITAVLLIAAWLVMRNEKGFGDLWQKLIILGAALLIIGYCIEPFQGGIKKDGPTFGYLLISSGLATFALIAFNIVCDYFHCHRSTAFLTMSGQNPMIAYVACDLLKIH